MRKQLRFILLAVILVILWGMSQPSGIQAQEPVSQLVPQSEQLWQLHQDDQPIATPLVAQAPRQPVATESVTYANLEGQAVTGYLARPAQASQALPALIVIHEWWGLNQNIKQMTERLAGEGYTALAVDLYEGQVAETPEVAKELVTTAQQNSNRLNDNLRQAYQYLNQRQQAPKIGSIGWCFGGTWSLNTALLFPERLDAAVIYYGGGITTDPEKLEPLQMPILGIFGELDQNPSVATVKQFESALKSLGKSIEVKIYPDANHAFANPSGTLYNATAAEDAWQKTAAFLAKYLKD
ncbi:MAG: dienelactone hydrolase family protein [Microcoleaceae cyanobacterium]